MANLITLDFFIGDINLPGRDKTGSDQGLQRYINEYGPVFMRQLLGLDFYNLFLSEIATPRMIALRDGKEYQVDGKTKYWQGLVQVYGTGENIVRISPIAIAIYLAWNRNKATRTTNTGEAKPQTDNSVQVNAIQKMVQVENKMVEIVRSMHEYLKTDTTTGALTYPEWDYTETNYYLLKKNNEFGF